ncbi:MAG: hypothetical protein MJZ89_01235 [Paludibacteraceae bacterium]|nr:hypothetical protein [Paludibacteraceae bacterium]
MKTKLTIVYYLVLITCVLEVLWLGYGQKMGMTQLEVISPLTQAGQIWQYLVITYMLVSVPGALWGFKQWMKKRVHHLPEGELKEQNYLQAAVLRMVLIGLGAILAIAAFYKLGGYMSMLWCAGICLVAMVFCKPTAAKIAIEMEAEEAA